ncbi:peroxiredoxin family protein [Rufibacter sediminis]|uniref:TlpA family protein disulfide reductase n=1 Tax=Rufibacter sediminis TaxID=2762756 RepID=A0ABR6VQB2_9BACT|nr:TlpA disulfide reductase family protein [Rufibacter sediminis]MBC3539390.1 TlpA family protein disulfide reductase [Rufibacter sediminis]
MSFPVKRFATSLVLSLALCVSTFSASWAQATVTISGKINNPVSDSILLELYTVPASYSGESHTVALSKTGEFTLKAPVNEPMLGELVHGPESIMLFLQPGDNLEVRAEADDFISSVKMKGQGVNENNYLLQFEREFEEEEDYQVLPDNIHKREKEFLLFLEERKEDQLAFLEKFLKKTKVSDAFKAYAQAQIEFGYANDRLTYVDVRKRVGDLPPQLSANYYDFLKQVNLNMPGALRNQAYLDFLNNYFQFRALQQQPSNMERDYYPTLYGLAKKELQGTARDMMLARILSQSFRFGYVPDADAMYQDFKKEAKDANFISFVNDQYKQFRRVGLGSTAPAFTLLSAKGDSVSLSDFKNKIVYLGFWRTHCGICTVDQQAYKYFAEQLAAKDIVLLQVTVGEDLNTWKQNIAQKKLPGIHLYAPDLSAQILKDYDVKSFPAYFMISPDGILINTNARRPGHAEGARETAAAIDQYRNSSRK